MIDPQRLLEQCEIQIRRSELPVDYFRSRVWKVKGTMAKILLENYREDPNGLSMRKKNFGIWEKFTWAQVYENVKAMALGLKSLGLNRGDKVFVIGDNDPEWYWAELALHCIGGVVVGLYVDAMSEDIEFIINNSDSVCGFAKDQEQVDKFLEARDKIPAVRRVIYWDKKGMAGYKQDPWLTELEELKEAGRIYEKEHPDFFIKSVEEGKDNDLAVLCYTSGTTGLPKGAMLSSEYLISAAVRFRVQHMAQKDDQFVSYVTPAWFAEQLMIAGWLLFKNTANFPEEPETVQENIHEIGSTLLLLGTTQWRSMVSNVQMKVLETGFLRRQLYNICIEIGHRHADYWLEHRRKAPWYWLFLQKPADWLCLTHIREALGLSKTRCGVSGGAAIGPDVLRWFLAIGFQIREGYGLTEINPVTGHSGYSIKPGTAGPPSPGSKIRISEDGEIQAWSDVMFLGYYKNPEASAAMISEDGWVKTGDCGMIDEDGQLVVYDRMKDMLILKSGAKYSPTYIQNRLCFSPYIKEAMIIGEEDREFLFAIITIDFDNVGKWAERNRISYTTFVDLSQKKEVYDLIEKDVVRVNKTLPDLARIGRFTLLHKEFDPDEGELTKSRKIRRSFLMERYGNLINAAFEGKESVVTEAKVKYRDGREGRVQTELKIRVAK